MEWLTFIDLFESCELSLEKGDTVSYSCYITFDLKLPEVLPSSSEKERG